MSESSNTASPMHVTIEAQPFGSAEESVEFMDTAPIPDNDREKIYHLNAEKLFRI